MMPSGVALIRAEASGFGVDDPLRLRLRHVRRNRPWVNGVVSQGRPLAPNRLSKYMPARQEAEVLRERARRLREIASQHRTAISKQLLEMADELDTHANELEQ